MKPTQDYCWIFWNETPGDRLRFAVTGNGVEVALYESPTSFDEAGRVTLTEDDLRDIVRQYIKVKTEKACMDAAEEIQAERFVRPTEALAALEPDRMKAWLDKVNAEDADTEERIGEYHQTGKAGSGL